MSSIHRAALFVLASALGAACGSDPAATKLSASVSGASASTVSAAQAATSTSAAPAHPSLPAGPVPCGALSCEVFDTPSAALASILAKDKPLLLALGESHALKGAEDVPSTTAHFTDELLPTLDGKAAAMVLELWVTEGKCGKEKEAKVAEQQKEVTQHQKDDNPNEFVKLGEKSKSLGIVPFILRPTCDEYDTIQKAGDNAVLEMLSMITRNMKKKSLALLTEAKKKGPDKLVVTYGGAMHNDLAPKKGREEWSFAADLAKAVSGRYVELDLVVPEFIKDNEAWRSLPWFSAYDKEKFAGSTVLIRMADHSYALVFPRTK
ncbi:MAG: hypothetical protein U0271_00525 [Polyangiaceae bacterium]